MHLLYLLYSIFLCRSVFMLVRSCVFMLCTAQIRTHQPIRQPHSHTHSHAHIRAHSERSFSLYLACLFLSSTDSLYVPTEKRIHKKTSIIASIVYRISIERFYNRNLTVVFMLVVLGKFFILHNSARAKRTNFYERIFEFYPFRVTKEIFITHFNLCSHTSIERNIEIKIATERIQKIV